MIEIIKSEKRVENEIFFRCLMGLEGFLDECDNYDVLLDKINKVKKNYLIDKNLIKDLENGVFEKQFERIRVIKEEEGVEKRGLNWM